MNSIPLTNIPRVEPDVVNKLMNDLADMMSDIRSQCDLTEELAREILDAENEKKQVLMKHVDGNTFLENGTEQGDVHTIYGGSEDDEPGGIRQVQRENINLKIELQRLEEVDSRYSSLLADYERAIGTIRRETKVIAMESAPSANSLISSYCMRLEEEKRTHDIFVVGYEELTRALSELKQSLVSASSAIDNAFKIQAKTNQTS